MDSLYPDLQQRFKSEGLCPVCLMEMELAPRYTCINQHTICYRCKPYYYNCPTCHSPLDVKMPSPPNTSYGPPPPTHFVPHPMPSGFNDATAPPMDAFQAHERGWYPPPPTQYQELRACKYAHLGCWVKVPAHLTYLHESRCQFRPHLEEENLPTDVAHKHDDLVECTYRVVGCNVKTSPWRISIHEQHCIYKDRYNETSISDSLQQTTISDPGELVECKYRKYGCMVRMPRRRKLLHQEKCNYREYDDGSSSGGEYDPDEQVPCKWAGYGCRVKPKRSRLETHVEKCNWRMEECAYRDYGCSAVFHPSARYAHERKCEFAN